VLGRALVIPASILATLFPMLAAAYGMDVPRLRQLVQTAAEVLLTATLPLVCFVAVVATPLMRLLFGAQFAPAGPALAILMIQFGISAFSYIAGDLVVVMRLQRRYVVYAGAGLVLNVALNVALIPRYGFLAAAWVSVFTEALVIGLSLRTALRTIDQHLRFARMVRIGLVSAAGAGGALAAHAVGLPLVVVGVVWLAALAVAWLIFRPWTPSELRTVLQSRKQL
jgi:O-antigen/teichoic acid export membrane protein